MRYFLAVLLLFAAIPAHAQLTIKDGNGAVQHMNTQADGAGNLSNRQLICDGLSNPDTCAPVSASNGLTVNLGTFSLPAGSNVIGGVTQSGTWSVTATQPTGTNLHVVCDSGCSSSSAPADEAAFTAGSTSQSPVGGFFQTTATNNALTTGQMGAFQVTANRALFVNLRNASGTEIGTASTPVQVSLANTGANGTAVAVTVSGTPGFNESQINGVAPLMGNGVSGTGSQRVNIASDNTPFQVKLLGNTGAAMDFAGQNASSPANSMLQGCQFNTSPTTITSGNSSPRQCDSAGNALVNLKTALPAGTNAIGAVTASQTITNPTSTLTLPATTTAYTAGNLIANNATAGSVVVPSFAIATSAGGAIIPRLRLTSNDATSTAWGGQTIRVDLWTTAPTWTNGDRGAWSPATNTSAHIGAYTCVMSSEFGTGVFSECYPNVGNATTVALASGTSVFWSLNAITGSGVTGASKAFTLTAELLN